MLDLAVTPAATQDLDEIAAFGIERFGAAVSDRYLSALEAVIVRLREYPDSGPVYTATRPPMRYISCGSHRIYYRHDRDKLTIVRIMHQARLPRELND